jgi:hypothetical protein
VPGQFLFQLERVEGVAGAALDVLADHHGEARAGAGGLIQQVGHAAVAGEACVGQHAPYITLAAGVDIGRPGLHVTVDGGDEPPGREPLRAGAQLPAH